MFRQVLSIWWLIIPVTVGTAVLELFVPPVAQPARPMTKPQRFAAFIVGGLLFGVMAVAVYNFISYRWPLYANDIYLVAALFAGAGLSSAALGMQ